MSKKNTPKVLFILKLRQTSGETAPVVVKSAGLLNSAKFVLDMLLNIGYDVKLVQVVDNNSIDKEVSEFKPDIVIIEALWVVPEKFEVLRKLHPNVKWVIRLHSEVPFLANEGVAIEWITKYIEQENVYVSANSMRAYTDLVKSIRPDISWKKILYLPNYYQVSKVKNESLWMPNLWKYQKVKELNVGCFGAIRPMKNHLIQAIAAIEFADRNGVNLNFHINSGRVEQRGETVLKNIRALFADSPKHKLIEHDWLDREDFIKIVKTMDIGLQVSMSETFNIVSADFVDNGIPMVTSGEVSWMPLIFTAAPTDTQSIVNAMTRAFYYKKYIGFFDYSKYNLEKYAKTAMKEWVHTLQKLY